MSTVRFPEYLECEPLVLVRRRMLLSWLLALGSALAWLVVYEAWQVLLALMVVCVLVGGG